MVSNQGTSMRTKNQFGSAFKQIRISKKLTQEDFAPFSGRTYLSEIERNKKHPTLKKIDELSEHLGVHPLTPLVMSYLQLQDETELDGLLQLVRDEVLEAINKKEQPSNQDGRGFC